MAEILSQDEIDHLLSAISSDEEKREKGSDGGLKSPVADHQNIKIYDFRRPDKFSKEQIRTISIMNETFARLTTTSLSTQLQSLVSVHVVSVDQLTYEEFLRSIPSPTTLGVINMDPLKGQAVIEIDPSISFMIIDRLFGGKGEQINLNRELSEIEEAVMESIIIRIIGNMRESWAQVVDLRPRLGNIETNPQFTQIVPPNEMVVLITMETQIENIDGMINFCIPYITLEPIISKLSAQYWYSSVRKGITVENLNQLHNRVVDIAVDIIAEIGRVPVSVKEALSLNIGDVVKLSNTSINDPITLNIGNKAKFSCRPGTSGKKMAVQVTDVLEEISQADLESLLREGEE